MVEKEGKKYTLLPLIPKQIFEDQLQLEKSHEDFAQREAERKRKECGKKEEKSENKIEKSEEKKSEEHLTKERGEEKKMSFYAK